MDAEAACRACIAGQAALRGWRLFPSENLYISLRITDVQACPGVPLDRPIYLADDGLLTTACQREKTTKVLSLQPLRGLSSELDD